MSKIYTEHHGPNYHVFKFDSMTDAETFVKDASWHKSSISFAGRDVRTFQDYHEKSQSLWEYGMEVLQRFINRLKNVEIPQLKCKLRRTKYNDFDGDEVDYDRLYAGQAFFRKSERETTDGPSSVTIVIDCSTPAFQRPDDMLWRGAVAIALAEMLESKGIRTEIWVSGNSNLWKDHTRDRVMVAVCVKRTSDPMDSSTLINAVSGWCYRSMFFSLKGAISVDQGKRYNSSYGVPLQPIAAQLDAITVDEQRILSSGVWNFHDACSMIQHELDKIKHLLND